jgi:hypothetical protein
VAFIPPAHSVGSGFEFQHGDRVSFRKFFNFLQPLQHTVNLCLETGHDQFLPRPSHFIIPSFDDIKPTELIYALLNKPKTKIFNRTSKRSFFHHEVIAKTGAIAHMPTFVSHHNGAYSQLQAYYTSIYLRAITFFCFYLRPYRQTIAN